MTRADKAGRVALVTGAAGSIGQAAAARLAADGATVVAMDIAPLEETGELIRATGTSGLCLTCDVLDQPGLSAAVSRVMEQFERIDIVVNVVGRMFAAPFAETDEMLWSRALTLNLTATYRVCREVIPHMVEAQYGRVINLASRKFWLPGPDTAAYSASKGAVIGLTRALAVEYGEAGITANVVAPGNVWTKRLEQRQGDAGAEAARIRAQRQAIKRVAATDDVVGTISFLTSDDAAYVTGQTVVVDGGLIFN